MWTIVPSYADLYTTNVRIYTVLAPVDAVFGDPFVLPSGTVIAL